MVSSIAAGVPRVGTARDERALIRALLLERRPDLAARLQDGPSGALLIPLPQGRGIEIGRMRRCGTARWVVVVPTADGAHLREPATLAAVALTALAALRRIETSRAAPAREDRHRAMPHRRGPAGCW